MNAAPQPRVPWWRRLAERTGNPLEWSVTDRALLVAALDLPFYIGNNLQLAQLQKQQELGVLFNLAYIPTFAAISWGVTALWALVLLYGGATRRRFPDQRWLGHFVAQLYIVHNSYAIYALGPVTSPWVVVVFGIPLFAFLLFDNKIAVPGVLSSVGIFIGTIVAERAGLIPYAPLTSGPPYVNGRVHNAWIQIMTGQVLVIFAINVAGVAFIINRWRAGSRALKRAYEELDEAHRELQRTKDELIRSESLAAVGSLVEGAAHELRNPLGSSGAMLQSLRDDLAQYAELSEEHRDDALQTVDMTLKGYGRARAIVDRLYDLTDRLRTGAAVRLGDFLKALEARYEGLEIALSDGLADARVPEALVKTVLPALLDNAVGAGGETPPRLFVSRADGRLLLEVADTGRGIRAEDIPHVFKPFFTGSKAGEGHGVGLGLYIVHSLVSRMEGEVALQSEPGRGTRVSVSVPSGE